MSESERIAMEGRYTFRKDNGDPDKLVRVLAVDGRDKQYPVIVESSQGCIFFYTAHGKYAADAVDDFQLDLIPARVLGEEYIGKHPRELPVGARFRFLGSGTVWTRIDNGIQADGKSYKHGLDCVSNVYKVVSLPDPTSDKPAGFQVRRKINATCSQCLGRGSYDSESIVQPCRYCNATGSITRKATTAELVEQLIEYLSQGATTE